MKLSQAQELAEILTSALRPYCADGKCQVAGSVRREVPEVKDIEIVCIPKRERFSALVLELSKFVSFRTKFTLASRYVKCWMPVAGGLGIQVDLFLPMPYDWGRQLAIRTGSAKYSAWLASQWIKKGYHGTPDGLIPKEHCESAGPNAWKVKPGVNPLVVRKEFWQEHELFVFLGIDYVQPKFRNK